MKNHVLLKLNSLISQPDKPQQKGYIERFNRSFRREFLNAYLFESLSLVREMSRFWQQDYNQNRTHESVGIFPRRYTENSCKTLIRSVSDNVEWKICH